MSSRRLPGKIMKIVDGKPVLYHVINQLSHSKLLKKIVIATSTNTDDDMVENYAKQLGISCFRGKLDDVLDRHYQCAKKFSFDTIVRIPSDKPLIDPNVIDEVITQFTSNQYDYVSNFVYPFKYSIGTEAEVFSFKALENAWKNAKLPSEREHVTPYFYKNKEIFRQTSIENSEDLSRFRCTVDTKYDLELIQKIYSNVKKRPILLSDVIKLFKANPQLAKINAHVKTGGYLRSLKEDKK